MDETTKAPPLPSREEFEQLVRAANGGNDDARNQLNEFLDRWPEIWRRLGDLGQSVQVSLIGKIAGNNPLLSESIGRKLEELRSELLTTGATPMERLSVERVLAAWLHLQQIDLSYSSTEGLSLPTAKFVLQLRESSQRRFDSATKSLATLRRLLAETPAAKRATLLRLHAGA